MKFKKCHTFQNAFVAFFQKNNAHYFPNFCNNALLHYLIFKNNALLHISRKSNAIMKCITAIMHYWKSARDCNHNFYLTDNPLLFRLSFVCGLGPALLRILVFFNKIIKACRSRNCMGFKFLSIFDPLPGPLKVTFTK